MTMLERIFHEILIPENVRDNPLETAESDRLFYNFCDKYINPHGDLDYQNNGIMDLSDIVLYERETAFKVGFRAAVELLTDK